MPMIGLARAAGLALLGMCASAGWAVAQQGPSLVGTWSARLQGQGGVVQATIGIGDDGTYAVESQFPNGSRMRVWGTYQATRLSDTQFRIVPQMTGWSPHGICTVVPGFSPRCDTMPPPPAPPPQVVTFISADAYQVDGAEWDRDPTAALLRLPVADPYVQYGQAPAAPPNLAPGPTYQTPTYDPRKKYEQGNSNFLNGHMRGCTLIDGKWQDCQQ